MWHANERGEVCTGFWFGAQEKRPPRKYRPRLDDNIKIDLKCNWLGRLD
jgi:hypothetical protein